MIDDAWPKYTGPSFPVERKCGVYLRVSTDRQDTANQLPALLQLCTARGYEPDIREEVESAGKVRPVLDRLCEDARRGKVQAVAVWALDRLGRNLWETLDRVRDLDRRGVRVLSFQETWIDTAGPARELLLCIFAWVAQFERQRLRERTKAGVAAARAKGKVLGRPRVDPGALTRALAWVRAGEPVSNAVAQWGVGEGTIRRALALDAKKGSQKKGAGPS